MKHLKDYVVWYSRNAKAKVKAFSKKGARQQAWRMIAGGHKYGWKRADFLKNAKVTRVV